MDVDVVERWQRIATIALGLALAALGAFGGLGEPYTATLVGAGMLLIGKDTLPRRGDTPRPKQGDGNAPRDLKGFRR